MVRYIFVDDAVGGEREELQPLIDNLTDSMEYLGGEELRIEPVYPSSFGEQRRWLREEDPDGVILDLWLDRYAPPTEEEDRKKQDYRALSLAQELRTRATEGNVGEFPIVLFSYDEKLNYSYNKDDTGHDLFDMKCLKDSLEDFGDTSKKVATRLVSLSRGYEQILDARRRKGGDKSAQFYKFLSFESDPGFLDPRLLAYFEGRETPIPAHEYARFILTQLLESPDHLKHPLEISGPLIPEDILAARLGVDIEESDEWNRVLEGIPEEAKYKGPFNEGWDRWWMHYVEKWWESLSSNGLPLRRARAEKRVEILKEALDITGLTPATPLLEEYSSEFWTVCQGSASSSAKDPLDPIDGFTLDRKNKQPWQDELYISEERAIEGIHFQKGYQIDPLEKELLEELKQSQRDSDG